MKKIVVIVIGILMGTVGAYAQGTLLWQDSQAGPYLITILSPDTMTPSIEFTGQTAYDEPAGTTQYSGGYIGGVDIGGPSGNGPGVGPTPSSGALGINYQIASDFTAGLYVDTSLRALTSDILTGTPAATTTLLGGRNSGLYSTTAPVYVSAFPTGSSVYVGIAAWYNGNGATSFASSSMLGKGAEGYVESISSVVLGGGAYAPGGLAGLGLTSFSLATSTPEPSTVALGLFGASALLARMLRKN